MHGSEGGEGYPLFPTPIELDIKVLNRLIAKHRNLPQIQKNIYSGTILAGGSMVTMVLSYPIFLHYVGAEVFGLWSSIAVVLSFSQLGNLGLNYAIVRFTAEEYAEGNIRAITEYVTTAFCLMSMPSIVIVGILMFCRHTIVNFLKIPEIYTQEALWLIPSIGMLSIGILYYNVIKGILDGIGRIDLSNYIFLSGRLIQVVLSVLFLALGWGVYGLFWGSATVYIITLFPILRLLRRARIPLIAGNGFSKNKSRKILSFGGTIFASQIIALLLTPFNKIIITRYIGLSTVTYYEIALRGAELIRSLFETGLRALMPQASALKKRAVQAARDSVRTIHAKGLNFVLVLGTPAFFAAFALSPLLLKLWIGNSYHPDISLAFRIFLIAQCVNLMCVPAYYIFMGLGQITICFNNIAIQSIMNVIVLLALLSIGVNCTFMIVLIVGAASVIIAALYVLLKFYSYKKEPSRGIIT
jgi:O-antigen/teichoic acid export membrane protein